MFLSFGGGRRACLGHEMALLQMKAAIVHITRKVKLSPPTEEVSVQDFDANCQVIGWMDGWMRAWMGR